MQDATSAFDPYRKWLGIRTAERPLSHYQLLGLEAFEDDAETISHAADQRIAYVRTLAISDFADLSQRVLNELAAAKVCLLNREKKAAYDEQLHAHEAATAPPPVAPPERPTVSPQRLEVLRPIPPAHLMPLPGVTQRPPVAVVEPALLPPMSAGIGVPALRLRTLPLAKRRTQGWSSPRRVWPLVAIAGLTAIVVLVGGAVVTALRKQDDGSVVAVASGRFKPKTASSKPKPINTETQGSTTPNAKPAPAIALAPFAPDQAQRHQEAWAQYLERQVVETNSIGMKLVLIPPGKFMMGTATGGVDSEKPAHEVTLTRAYYLGDSEVTIEQFGRFIDDPEYPAAEKLLEWQGAHNPYSPTPDCPVQQVSWFDAILFCNWLSAKEGRKPAYERTGEKQNIKDYRGIDYVCDVWRCDFAGDGYRLPTESEWEYTCRAGSSGEFCYGDDESRLPQYGSFGGNSNGRTWPAGTRLANAWGLFDMHGNLWEWCWDWLAPYVAGTRIDPVGPAAGSERVLRGGNFNDAVSGCRCAFRDGVEFRPVDRHGIFGFRVARTVTAESPGAPPTATGSSQTRPNAAAENAASVNPPPLAIAPFDTRQAKAHQEAWAKYLGRQVVETNSIGMKFVLIPPGEFMMGSPQAEIDTLVRSAPTDLVGQELFRSEGPQHVVRLTRGFYLGISEVTQKQYQDLMAVNPSGFSPTGAEKGAVQGLDTNQHPVERVSWFDAVDFCNKLSEKEDLPRFYSRQGDSVILQGGTGYRLSTEAEWEYACRAGTTTKWSFGDNAQNAAQHAWIDSIAASRPHRAGELVANSFGFYDLAGNVWEWCWDWQGNYAASDQTDPTQPNVGSRRVLRGGSFAVGPPHVRTAIREGAVPTTQYSHIGFRVARTATTEIPESPPAPTKSSVTNR